MRRIAHLSFALLLLAGRPAVATEFWFSGEDPVTQKDKHRPGPADYMDLFAPGAPWQRAESRVSVFKFSAQLVLRGTDEMLRTIFAGLRQHHISPAVEMGAVLRGPECGGGEGYAPPNLVDRVAGRLQRLGLTLDYWDMDEPVWFAHVKSWGPNTCTYPIGEVAKRVARNVAVMRRYFPAIRVGEADVLAADRIPTPELVADYVAFAQAFRQQTGQPLAFFHADVAVRGGGMEVLPPLFRQLHALGIPTGVIIGGTPQDQSDEEWVAHALQGLRMLEANPATRPDQVVVQSWQPLPDHMLPETQPGSSTFLLREAEILAR